MLLDVVCKNCCSSIHKDAKVCPFCLSPQTTGYAFKRFAPALVLFLIFFIVFQVVDSFRSSGYKEPVQFLEHKDSLSIISSELSFTACGECKSTYNAVVIGTLKNTSQYGWEDIKIEVRFYDKDQKMIDSISEMDYDMVVQPNAEVSFRVMDRAAKPTESYTSHKIYINDAQQVSDYY